MFLGLSSIFISDFVKFLRPLDICIPKLLSISTLCIIKHFYTCKINFAQSTLYI